MKKNNKRFIVPVMVCFLFACCFLLSSCGKKNVGGVDLSGVDIEEISSNASIILDEDKATKSEEPSNSASPSKKPSSTSEVINETAVPQGDTQDSSVSILAVGDNLYHMNIIKSGLVNGAYNYDHIYEKLSDDIKSVDYAVVNQETVFAPDGYTPEGYPSFLSPNEIADALVKAGFDVVLQATNHTADKGSEGILHTLDKWSEFSQIKVLGINKTQEDVSKISVVEKNGIKIAMLNYTEISNKGLGSGQTYLMNVMSEDRIKSDVQKAKKIADVVIVFPHWGTEYVTEPTEKQKKWAQFMADLGVDVVIGTHPHVIEPVEWVTSSSGHKMLVYYSLGNFVSRQIEGERLLGGMAKVNFDKVDGEVKISYASVTPLMMHYERYANKNTFVMRLDQYTQELADKHGVSYYESLGTFTFDKVKKLAVDVFGSTTEQKIKIE